MVTCTLSPTLFEGLVETTDEGELERKERMEDQTELVGKTFVGHYYHLFDNDRASLSSLYQPTSCSHLKAKKFLELMISLPSLTSYRSINADTWSAPLIPSPVHPPVAYSSLSAAAFSWPERTTTWDSARLWISLYFTSPIVVLDIYYLYKSSHIYCTLQWHKTKHWYWSV